MSKKVLFKSTGLTNDSLSNLQKDMNQFTASSAALPQEDEFTAELLNKAHALEPPVPFYKLEALVENNNALQPAIDAMVANIDGTGWVIDFGDDTPFSNLDDSEEPQATTDSPEADKLRSFFNEPYPKQTFMSQRKDLRRDLETTGNAFLEVIRNVKGEIIFVKPIPARNIRLAKLDEPQLTKVVIERDGKNRSVDMMVRWRRYAQAVSNDVVYFKDFNAPKDLDKETGKWADDNTRLKAAQRATELIHFKAIASSKTPYGLPRWFAQAPSVIGSRRAEEHNLEFFETGGIPPVLITVSGGELAEGATEALTRMFSGRSKTKEHAVVIEAFSSEGSLDGSAGKVGIKVDKFDTHNDSMFEGYDERSSSRIRSSFRLPALFVGMEKDINFATAFASYTIAEAQVFKPERDEFDEIITLKLLQEIAPDSKLRFRSLPLQIKNLEAQLAATEVAFTSGALAKEDLIHSLNEVTGTELAYTDVQPEEGEDPNDAILDAVEVSEEAEGNGDEGTPSGTKPAMPGEGLRKR